MKMQSMSRKKLRNNRTYSSDFSKGKNYSRGNMLNKNEEQNENINNNYVQVNEEKENNIIIFMQEEKTCILIQYII